ncbi:MAG TPA: tetratricopeptide repeat protein, partial [Trueperaceae bacterium]
GAVSLELERPQLARDYWQRILTLVPKDAQAAYFLKMAQDELRWGVEANRAFRDGVDAYQKGDLQRAASSLATATRLNPKYAEAWAWRGRLAFEAEDYQEAEKLFARAAGLAPAEQSYGYFAEESARRSAGGQARAAAAAPDLPAPPEPAPSREAAARPTAERNQPVVAVPVDAQAVAAVPRPEPTPEPTPQPRPAPEPEPTPQPAAPARPAAAGPPLVLLDVDYTHQSASAGEGGAFVFFDLPDDLPVDFRQPVDYAGGMVYQRLEVTAKPSDAPVLYQLCLIPNDNLNVKPACSSKNALRFQAPGVYQHSAPLASFSGFGDIDWNRGLREAMLILNDADGRPVDQRYAMAGQEGPDPTLYYPMEVHYTVVLVPKGGRFAGWP